MIVSRIKPFNLIKINYYNYKIEFDKQRCFHQMQKQPRDPKQKEVKQKQSRQVRQKQVKVKSSLRLKSKTPLQKDEVHKINTILMHLNNHNDSIDFRQPVDWRGLELYDYLDVVKCPMDLGTINNKLRQKKYRTVQGVLNDIQLIWDNCKLYNSKDSDIYELADKLELSFRRMVRNYLPNLKVATVTSTPIKPITQPPFTIVFKPQRQLNTNMRSQQIGGNLRKQFVSKMQQLNEQNLTTFIEQIEKWAPQSLISFSKYLKNNGQQEHGNQQVKQNVQNELQNWSKFDVQLITDANIFYKLFNLINQLLTRSNFKQSEKMVQQ